MVAARLTPPVSRLTRNRIDLTRSRSRIVFHPLPLDDPRRRQPDTNFGDPQVPIAAGLERTIAYFRTVANGLKRWVA